MSKSWMIYGANGYTGKLIAREAAGRGLNPILAGRNHGAVATLASELQLEFRVFDLENSSHINKQLADVDLLLNCAGPFTKTVQPLLEACIVSHCHYLDISGELSVFETCNQADQKAKQAQCIVCPGVAFDIVPTEVAAAKLKQLLPNAVSLKLGFDGQMALSQGSSITLVEGVGNPDLSVYMVREEGNIKHLPRARVESLVFESGKPPQKAMAITWADLNGAFYSTQIPNIAVYIPATLVNRVSFTFLAWLKPLFTFSRVQNSLAKLIKSVVKGPTSKELESGSMKIFGAARAEDGETVRIFFTVAHGYKFTYLSALAAVEHCLQSGSGKSGYVTPSMLLGVDFIETLEGSSSYRIERIPAPASA